MITHPTTLSDGRHDCGCDPCRLDQPPLGALFGAVVPVEPEPGWVIGMLPEDAGGVIGMLLEDAGGAIDVLLEDPGGVIGMLLEDPGGDIDVLPEDAGGVIGEAEVSPAAGALPLPRAAFRLRSLSSAVVGSPAFFMCVLGPILLMW